MSDRSPRLLLLPTQPVRGGERGAVLLREHPASPSTPSRETGDGQDEQGSQETPKPTGSGQGPADDNPFAPPPEGTPDRPWQPRHPSGATGGSGGTGGGGDDGRGNGGRSPWGGRWSDRQPGRSSDGFGERPGRPNGPGGPQGPGGPSLRWDPTDPVQRRARYALLSGMWGFFFALFGWPYLALLLGALALYWGGSSLRAKPRTPDPDSPAAASGPAASGSSPGGGHPEGTAAASPFRPQRTAAISGLVTGSLALATVAAAFSLQFVYQDYYTCRNDALTTAAEKSCDEHLPEDLPEWLRGVLGAES